MADVITRFKLETTQFDSKLRDASKELASITKEAQSCGSSFTNFSQKSIEAARALGQTASGASTTKDKVRDLVGAYNEAAKAYNNLTVQQQQSDFGKAMAASLEELKGRIGEAKEEMQGMSQQSNDTGGVLDRLANKFSLNIDVVKLFNIGLQAAKAALDVAMDAFFSSEQNVDNWGRTVAAADSIYDAFLQSLNNGDFSGFFQRLDGVIAKAREAYDAMDQLNTVMTIINPERAKIQARQTELKSIIRRQGADSDAGKAAQTELKSLEPKLRKAFQTESKLNYNAFATEVDRMLQNAGINLNASSHDFLMRSFSDESVFNRLKAGAKGSLDFRELGGLENRRIETVDTRNTNQKLLDLFTDEWRQQFSPYLTAAYTARGSAASQELGNARYLRESKTSGSTGSRTTPRSSVNKTKITQPVKELKVETTESLSQLQILEDQLKTVQNSMKFSDNADDWKAMSDEAENLKNQIKEIKGEGGVQLVTTETLGTLQILEDQLSTIQESMKAAVTPEDYGAMLDAAAEVQAQIDEFKKGGKVKEEKKDYTENISKALSGLSTILSGIEAVGFEIPDSVKNVINAIQGLMTIVQGVQTVISVFSTTSQTANTAAVVALTAAVTANTTALIANSATNFIPLATGGIVHAAEGFRVPGNYFSGDQVPALLNSGELVLNRAQQGNLASQLTSADGTGRLEAVVSGEQIRFVLNNNARRTGHGEYLTIK